MEYCCLLDSMEIPSLDVVPTNFHQYLDDLLNDDAAIWLRAMLPIMANICEVYLINILTEKVAYMVEDTDYCRCLFQYCSMLV